MAWVEIDWPVGEKPVKKNVDDGLIFGRSDECEAIVGDKEVSAKHAWIRRIADGYYLIDLRSTNGVTINGEKILEAELHDGDVFCLSDVVCRFFNPGEIRKPKPTDTIANQCASCGYLLTAFLEHCPRCKAPITGEKWSPDSKSDDELRYTKRFVRVLSSLAFAGGLVGPLLLGIGWAIGIVLGVMVLSGYGDETDATDRKMAWRGILLGLLWLALMIWVAQLFIR